MIGAVTTAYKMLGKHGFADIMQNSHTGENRYTNVFLMRMN